MKIGFFDSGHGGTTVLKAVKAILPDEEYQYIADIKHCPYGEKSDEELYKIAKANVEKLKEWGAKIIVIACNTATVKCIDELRLEFPELKFVGTEPAIKVAARSGAKKILVLATPATVGSGRTKALVEESRRPGQSIKLLPCPGLADAIEHNFKDDQVYDLKGEVKEKVYDLLSNEPDDYDAVVLGCTHYIFAADLIKKYFPKANLIEGGNDVAKRVKTILEELAE